MMEKSASDIWWKNCVCYCVDVKTFSDSDGDGWGDLIGLTRRLGYLRDLGVTCLWLMPCYPSPLRDDGYDISDYYTVDPRVGSLGDYVEMVRTANDLGIRVVMDLVVNHTSVDHPWFQTARREPRTALRDFYIWRGSRPPDLHDPVFPGEQASTWTWDERAGAYYFHHYYDSEPDLDTMAPAVQDQIHQIMGFWLQLGADGFRIDSLPFLIDKPGVDGSPEERHAPLRSLRDFVSRRSANSVLLGEANVPTEEQRAFFGDPAKAYDDSEAHVLFDFEMQAKLWLALARESADPIREVLRHRPDIPEACAYAVFARHHDELTFEKVVDEGEAAEIRNAFDPDGVGGIYGRGLRRRLASLLDGDETRIRLLLSLVMSLPGMPVLLYGDEIGLRDNLDLEGRLAPRVPMQWTDGPGLGFSSAPREQWVRQPAKLPGGAHAHTANVRDQRHHPESLLAFVRHLTSLRRECPEIGYGRLSLPATAEEGALALRYDWQGGAVILLHNLSGKHVPEVLCEPLPEGELVRDLSSPSGGEQAGTLPAFHLGPHDIRWLRVVPEGAGM